MQEMEQTTGQTRTASNETSWQIGSWASADRSLCRQRI